MDEWVGVGGYRLYRAQSPQIKFPAIYSKSSRHKAVWQTGGNLPVAGSLWQPWFFIRNRSWLMRLLIWFITNFTQACTKNLDFSILWKLWLEFNLLSNQQTGSGTIHSHSPTAISWTDLIIENHADVCSVLNPLSLANIRQVKEEEQPGRNASENEYMILTENSLSSKYSHPQDRMGQDTLFNSTQHSRLKINITNSRDPQ